MTKMLHASAPGKLVLLGEYAVLLGAPALVAAVECRAHAHFAPKPSDKLILAAPQMRAEMTLVRNAEGTFTPPCDAPEALGLIVRLVCAVQRLGGEKLAGGKLTLDTTAFYRGETKLGLGSSAAIATAAALALGHAQSAAFVASPKALFDWVHPIHRAHQANQGSGIDIAASCFGGFLRFEAERALPPPTDPGCDAQALAAAIEGRSREAPRERRLGIAIDPIVPMSELLAAVSFVGKAAKTPIFLRAFENLRTERPEVFWPLLEEIASLSHGGVEMWTLGQADAFLAVVQRFYDALGRLGAAMGQPVISLEHERLARFSRWANAAYKPSGAGGGDVGIAFCKGPLKLWWLRWALRLGGGLLVPIKLGAQGARLET